MKAKDLRERTVEDLTELAKSLAKDSFQARMKNFTNRLDDTSTLGKNRKTLARVHTILKQKSLGIEPVAKAATEAPAKKTKKK